MQAMDEKINYFETKLIIKKVPADKMQLGNKNRNTRLINQKVNFRTDSLRKNERYICSRLTSQCI